MKKILLTITLIISINNSYCVNAISLNKGETAPFSGALVKPERLDSLVKAEKKNIVLKDLGLVKDELIEYHKDSAKKYRKKLAEEKFNSFWTNTGYFLLGIILGSVAVKTSEKIGNI